jgi:hypothetical protein
MPEPTWEEVIAELEAEERTNQRTLEDWAPDAIRLKNIYAPEYFIPNIDAIDPDDDEWE